MASNRLGEFYAKGSDGEWYPVTGAWIKQNGQWTSIANIWLKNSLGGTSDWEQVYPITSGYPQISPGALTYSVYNNYVLEQTVSITNAGVQDFTIDAAYTENNPIFATAVAIPSGGTFPITVAPAQTANLLVLVGGVQVGNSTANVTFVNNLGTLGYANITIPIVTTVGADYNGIQVSPTVTQQSFLLGNVPTPCPITITNSGNGGNLNIQSITSSLGSTITDAPVTIGYDWQAFMGNSATFLVTLPNNLQTGTYSDQITILSDAQNSPSVTVAINANVIQPHGAQAFTQSGVYSWTVPLGVYSVTTFVIGGGGGGGAGGASMYATEATGGGGGGSGGITADSIPVIPGEILTIQVGPGGAAGLGGSASTPVSAADGASGGNSSVMGNFGTMAATGGSGGLSASVSGPGTGGAGGQTFGFPGADGATSAISSSGFGVANGGSGGNNLFYFNNGTWNFVTTCDSPLYPVSQSAYPKYMNNCAVWVTADASNPIGIPQTVNFTFFNITPGVYNFYAAADDQLTMYVNGQLVGSVTSYPTNPVSFPVTLGRGYVKLTCSALNMQGTAGFTVFVVDSFGNLIWNTRSPLYSPSMSQAIYGSGGAGGISYGYTSPYWWQGQPGSDGGVFLMW